MTRHLVLGALVGFGLAVLLLAAFGTGDGLVPPPAPPPDAGEPQRIRAIKLQPPVSVGNSLRRQVFQRAGADAGTPDAGAPDASR